MPPSWVCVLALTGKFMTESTASNGAHAHTANAQLPLVVQALHYEVDGVTLIDGLDLTLHGGGITVLMGPNGAGKSVLLRLLHGLLQPSAGIVSWHGTPNGKATRMRQALVFQRPVLLRRSVVANVEFALKLTTHAKPPAALALLAKVGLAQRATQPARLLSGGEQQRLAMARALALQPQVLFMDEPTASLDPASVLAIEQIAKAASQESTKIIWVTHDLGQAQRVADDVVFLHHGRITEHTEASSFFSAPSSSAAQDYVNGRLVL